MVCLYSINNKLQQPEEAFGVLEYARKHHRADLVCKCSVTPCTGWSIKKQLLRLLSVSLQNLQQS